MAISLNDRIKEYIDECIRKRKDPKPPTLDELNGYVAEFMERYNNLPREEFEGYSPHEMAMLLHRPFDKGSPLELKPLTVADCRQIPLFRQVEFLLETIVAEGGVKLTPKGNLPMRIVKNMYALGAPDDMIEKGYAILRTEDDTISVQLAHGIAKIAGAVKKRDNKLTLTKKGESFLSNKLKLAAALIEAVCCDYHPGYFDSYRAEGTGRIGVGFTLTLLNKYGAEKRPDLFYSDKYFKAFPDLLEEGVGVSCYSARIFDRMLNHLGVITIEKTMAFGPDREVFIEKTALFDKIFLCRPPRYISKTGKS